MDLTFELLCDELCDPLWFKALFLTTKSHQGLTKVHKVLFQQPQLSFAPLGETGKGSLVSLNWENLGIDF
jgi:hypothetical protein